jgi:hypothetical protein
MLKKERTLKEELDLSRQHYYYYYLFHNLSLTLIIYPASELAWVWGTATSAAAACRQLVYINYMLGM